MFFYSGCVLTLNRWTYRNHTFIDSYIELKTVELKSKKTVSFTYSKSSQTFAFIILLLIEQNLFFYKHNTYKKSTHKFC